jgi:hypothetical protein
VRPEILLPPRLEIEGRRGRQLIGIE